MPRQAPNWAADDAARAKFDRNAVEIPRYSDIEASFAKDGRALVRVYLEGDLTEQQLLSAFKNRMVSAETEAFVAGRRARGDTRSTVSDEEAQMLVGRHSRNMKYFNRFVQDMQTGKGRMNYEDRVGLYAKSMWSLYTRGETSDWQDPQKKNARYYWIMDPDAEHCKTCLDRAGQSRDKDGFTWEELSEIGWPGEHTPCQVNCRCHIRTVNRKVVLPEHFDEMQEARDADGGLTTLQDLMGGEHLPLKLPAAGVPSVSVSPDVITSSLAGTIRADDLAKKLPLLPKLLTKPLQIYDNGVRRIYTGHGLDATLGRDDKGLWQLLALALGHRQGEKVA